MCAGVFENLRKRKSRGNYLVPALDRATKSYVLKQKDLTQEYIEILQEGTNDLKLLEKQVPGFRE